MSTDMIGPAQGISTTNEQVVESGQKNIVESNSTIVETSATNRTSPILPVAWQGENWGALSTAEKDASKDNRSRLIRYDAYIARADWHNVDLLAYRDSLLLGDADSGIRPLVPSTVSAHLSTIRARYAALLRDKAVRAEMYTIAGEQLSTLGQDDTPANRAAIVQELTEQIKNAIDPKSAPVQAIKRQDEKAGEFVRLTRGQASKLISSPGLSSSIAIRDTALIALALCSGLREFELCDLDVRDLRQKTKDGALAVEVRKGKGCKQRLVPYGLLSDCLAFVDAWLEHAGIIEGAVFRGFYKGAQRLRPGRLTTRSVRKILECYPVMIDGKLSKVAPHDLRRTYACRLFDDGKGLAIEAIQQNLGHADVKTTLRYIGILSSSARQPMAVYDFDLSELGNVPVQGKLDTSRPGATADSAGNSSTCN